MKRSSDGKKFDLVEQLEKKYSLEKWYSPQTTDPRQQFFQGQPFSISKESLQNRGIREDTLPKIFYSEKEKLQQISIFHFCQTLPPPIPSKWNKGQTHSWTNFLHICYYMHLFLITFFRTYSALFVYLFWSFGGWKEKHFCVIAKAISGLLTCCHFCRRCYSRRLTIMWTKGTSVASAF